MEKRYIFTLYDLKRMLHDYRLDMLEWTVAKAEEENNRFARQQILNFSSSLSLLIDGLCEQRLAPYEEGEA